MIEAEPGELVRWGQNDLRGKSHTYRQYGIVLEDGTVHEVDDDDACALAQGATTLDTITRRAAEQRAIAAAARVERITEWLERGYMVVPSGPLPEGVRVRLTAERDRLVADLAAAHETSGVR